MKRKKGLRGIDGDAPRKPKKGIRPAKIFIYALALAALGGGGYLLYDHFRRKKLIESNNTDTVTTGGSVNTENVYTSNVNTSDTTTTASKKKTTARTTANDDFPLKKGSKGARVVKLQEALIKKGSEDSGRRKVWACNTQCIESTRVYEHNR